MYPWGCARRGSGSPRGDTFLHQATWGDSACSGVSGPLAALLSPSWEQSVLLGVLGAPWLKQVPPWGSVSLSGPRPGGKWPA